MNNEQQELLSEVYENYVKWWEESDDSCNLTEEQYSKWLKLVDGGLQWAPLTKEEFINKCKIDDEFAKKWCRIDPIKGSHYFIHNITIKRTGDIESYE
jgi:hypothetical protein